ncbi:hypothetical protein Tco_0813029 [Tanacetum coccineum]
MKNRSDGVKAKPRHHRGPLITHTLRIILIPSILCVDFILDNEQKAKEHKRAILLISRGDVIDWEFLARQNLDQAFFNSISTDLFFGPQWGNIFRVNEPVYWELVHEFFASIEFDASPCRYNPNHLGVRFRLGGEQKEISLLELGWRIGLYFEGKSRENETLSRLRGYNTVNESRLLLEFWPTIGDGGFNMGNIKVASIKDLRVKLAHRCIPTTIRKPLIESPRLTSTISIVSTFLRSFGLLTNEFRNALSIEAPPHVFKK